MLTNLKGASIVRFTVAPALMLGGLGVALVAGAVLTLHDAPKPLWVLCVLLGSCATIAASRPMAKEARAVSRALHALPAQQIGDVIYAGNQSALVLTVKCRRFATMLDVEQLCRTHTGHWFSYYCYVPLGGAEPISQRVLPRSPDFARGCLLTHEGLYRRYFGLKNTAHLRSYT